MAFNTTNIVPGIDFSNDPLLQGRNFSYLDTQLSRLGSPNFTELPINRPVFPVNNNEREAHMRYEVNKGRVAYAPATLDGHSPGEVTNPQGFQSYPEQVSGPKVRARSESFGDHYGQARLFWNSMTPPEKEHIVKALQFELSKVETRDVRVRMIGHLTKINDVLGAQIARVLGETTQSPATPGGTANSAEEIAALADATSPTSASGGLQQTSGLSLLHGQPCSAKGRKVAILAADGVDAVQVEALQAALKAEGAKGEVVGTHLGMLGGGRGEEDVRQHRLGAVRRRLRARRCAERCRAPAAGRCRTVHRRGVQARQAGRRIGGRRRPGRRHPDGPPACRRPVHVRRRTGRLSELTGPVGTAEGLRGCSRAPSLLQPEANRAGLGVKAAGMKNP